MVKLIKCKTPLGRKAHATAVGYRTARSVVQREAVSRGGGGGGGGGGEIAKMTEASSWLGYFR